MNKKNYLESVKHIDIRSNLALSINILSELSNYYSVSVI